MYKLSLISLDLCDLESSKIGISILLNNCRMDQLSYFIIFNKIQYN